MWKDFVSMFYTEEADETTGASRESKASEFDEKPDALQSDIQDRYGASSDSARSPVVTHKLRSQTKPRPSLVEQFSREERIMIATAATIVFIGHPLSMIYNVTRRNLHLASQMRPVFPITSGFVLALALFIILAGIREEIELQAKSHDRKAKLAEPNVSSN